MLVGNSGSGNVRSSLVGVTCNASSTKRNTGRQSLAPARIRVPTVISQLPQISTVDANIQYPEERDGTISALNAAIEALNLTKEVTSITPAEGKIRLDRGRCCGDEDQVRIDGSDAIEAEITISKETIS